MAGQDGIQPQAIDFAITSGLRDPQLGDGEAEVALIFREYEDFKRGYKDTDAQCRRQGLTFLPFVVEAHAGGWSPVARRAISSLASDIAAATHSDKAAVSLRIAQRISCSLQRESARAILRRRQCVSAPAPAPTGWDAVTTDPSSWQ